MINFDEVRRENIKYHTPNLPHIPDHPYRILTTGGSASEKTNVLLNLGINETSAKIFYMLRIHLSQSINS